MAGKNTHTDGSQTETFAQEDRASRAAPQDGPKWNPSDQRGKSCFAGEESGVEHGSTAPLINEKKPTL